MTKRLAAGIDLGGTKILSAVMAEDGSVLGEDRCLTLAAEGPDAVVRRIIESLERALVRAEVEAAALEGAGISSPGPLDPWQGIVTEAVNLPGFRNVPLARLVSDACGRPALLEHDAAAAAYGELRFGAGAGFRHLVYVTVSTGIGAGIIIDGRVYRGASGAAGEVGHMSIDEQGPPCNCGSRGCVEAFSSGLAIARQAAEAMAAGRSPLLQELAGGAPPTPELVHEAATRGDAACREVIEEAGRRLGIGLAGVLNCLDPQALIVGGGLTGLGDLYLRPAFEAARGHAFEQNANDVTIGLAKLGDFASALGAAALMLDQEPR